MAWTRRGLLGAAGASLLLPSRPALAATSERRFLFVYCRGGWDTTGVLLPKQGNSGYSTEAEASTETLGGIPFTDHPERPAVREFYETWADRTAVLHGFEVRSITHERCRQLLFAGASGGTIDDWGSILAGQAATNPLLPHVVLSGPSFSSLYTDRVVRVGSQSQLVELLDGSAFWASDIPVAPMDPGHEALVDAYVRERVDAAAALATDSSSQGLTERYGQALSDLQALGERGGLQLTPQPQGCMRDLASDCAAAFDLFSQGLARCAVVEFNGWCDQSWDTHQVNSDQSLHWQTLFEGLNLALADLEFRPGVTGSPLVDEVVVCVVSEMGRAPKLNTWAGKDHWTFTSAMLIGPMIQGGQAIGDLDDEGIGRPIDLATGEVHDDGTALLPGHLGATLLALGDVDPGEWVLQGEAPIEALIR